MVYISIAIIATVGIIYILSKSGGVGDIDNTLTSNNVSQTNDATSAGLPYSLDLSKLIRSDLQYNYTYNGVKVQQYTDSSYHIIIIKGNSGVDYSYNTDGSFNSATVLKSN